MKLQSYKELVVWQKSIELVREIYKVTGQFPKEEMYVLSSQMRRAAVSIPSNIAEGRRKGSKKEFHQFLTVAYGSSNELETQIEISKRLPFGKNLDYVKIDTLLVEVRKMLNKLLFELNS